MHKPILIVIDMQGYFDAANNPSTISACQSLINSAIRNRNPIVIVEYIGAKSTLKEITNLTKDYDLAFLVRKSTDDGSQAIESLFDRCQISPRKLIICGVNTDACVLATVIGLTRSNKKYKISVVKKACHTDFGTGERALQTMKKNRNVVIQA